MAVESTTLRLVFQDAEGSDLTHNFKYADQNAQSADVRALMLGMIANGDIYNKPPATIKTASIIVTTSTDLDVAD